MRHLGVSCYGEGKLGEADSILQWKKERRDKSQVR